MLIIVIAAPQNAFKWCVTCGVVTCCIVEHSLCFVVLRVWCAVGESEGAELPVPFVLK